MDKEHSWISGKPEHVALMRLLIQIRSNSIPVNKPCIRLGHTYHRASCVVIQAVFNTQCGYDLLAVTLAKWGTAETGCVAMALGVDKALSDTSSQMENTSYGRWKTRIPEFIHSGQTRPFNHRTVERTRPANVQEPKDSDKERSGSKKTVTMAPVSRYMPDKSLYIMRKPLISTQWQVPILKNSSAHEDSERVRI